MRNPSPFQLAFLFVTASRTLQTSSRQVSSFSSPLTLPNRVYRLSGAMQSHRHSYTVRGVRDRVSGRFSANPVPVLCSFLPVHVTDVQVLRGLDDFPSLKLLTYQQKLYKCFADPELREGQIRCALLAGYLPAFPDGLTPPSGLHRLNGLFQGETEWLYLPVALEGNHSAWRLLADSYFMENYLLHEPREDGKHILIVFGLTIEERFAPMFDLLEKLWRYGAFQVCVEQMKELGQLFLADNKEVIYVILVDGVLDWVEKWVEHEAEGAEASHVFKYLKEQGINILFGRWGLSTLSLASIGIYEELYEDARKELEQAREENERLKMELAEGGVGEEMVTG